VANENRLINEVRREYFLSRDGARDALWSLARAILEAEELVYIETPGLARTARPQGTPAPQEIDLIALLAQRMSARPNLKAIIVTPRDGDLIPAPFARRAFAQRKEAYDTLSAAAPGRVAAFHPKGFPGRDALIRSTIVIVSVVVLLLASTAFYVAVQPLQPTGGTNTLSMQDVPPPAQETPMQEAPAQ
jgi:hypothetical protein